MKQLASHQKWTFPPTKPTDAQNLQIFLRILRPDPLGRGELEIHLTPAARPVVAERVGRSQVLSQETPDAKMTLIKSWFKTCWTKSQEKWILWILRTWLIQLNMLYVTIHNMNMDELENKPPNAIIQLRSPCSKRESRLGCGQRPDRWGVLVSVERRHVLKQDLWKIGNRYDVIKIQKGFR